jgi:hypothetical protein
MTLDRPILLAMLISSEASLSVLVKAITASWAAGFSARPEKSLLDRQHVAPEKLQFGSGG